MVFAEPIIVVLGPRCGGTSAVAGVLHHLGVFMGADFVLTYRELDKSWEDTRLSQLCRRAFNERSLALQMSPGSFEAKLRSWAHHHYHAARIAGRRPGAKDPLLCLAIGFIIDAGIPMVPVVVDRPFAKVVASLNRLEWFADEQERAESTAHLIGARDSALAGVATVKVDFEALRATPADVIRRLVDELGLEVTETQLEAAANSVVKQADVPREVDPFRRLIEQLLPEVERNPADAEAVYNLAQFYFGAEDFANAHKWYTRFIDIGAPDEDIFLAMLRVAQSMEMLHVPWPEIQDAYLRTWEFRPTRAEPFFGIARHYSAENRYRLGYLFAERAAQIPLPEDDMIVLEPDLYAWWAALQQAVCAYQIGKQTEAFALWRRVLARPDIPDGVRQSIADELGLAVTEAQLKAAADSVMKPADVPRDVDPDQRFIELPQPEVTDNPDDLRPVSTLAQTYFHAGDYASARTWFERMIELGDSDEGTFWAMLRLAQSMEMLGEPWPDVQDAYIRAWEFRPTRAEPLYDIARHYIAEKRARLGYLFAQRAAEIPLPEGDKTIPHPDLYAWRTTFQQLVCAYHIDKQAEAFTLSRRLLARPDIPDADRQGIASIRDLPVPTMLEAASSYPDVLARNLIAGPPDAEVTASLVAGPDRAATEQTLNSFLHSCADVSRAGRFLVVDAGLSAQDRAILQEGYKFIEFADCRADHAPGPQLKQLRDQIHGRYWLHLGQGWQFFAPENLITRLTAVLDAETQVFQVGINLADAVRLTGISAPEQTVRRTPDAGRYVRTETVARGPSMFDTARLDRTGGMDSINPDPIAELGRCAAAAGLQTASLDEVLCITAV